MVSRVQHDILVFPNLFEIGLETPQNHRRSPCGLVNSTSVIRMTIVRVWSDERTHTNLSTRMYEKLKENEEMLRSIGGEGGTTPELLLELHQQNTLILRELFILDRSPES